MGMTLVNLAPGVWTSAEIARLPAIRFPVRVGAFRRGGGAVVLACPAPPPRGRDRGGDRPAPGNPLPGPGRGVPARGRVADAGLADAPHRGAGGRDLRARPSVGHRRAERAPPPRPRRGASGLPGGPELRSPGPGGKDLRSAAART